MSAKGPALCSLAPLRFICDEMLRGVGGRLRLAGYDTLLPSEGESDSALLARAQREDRWLITRDRGLEQYAGAMYYLVLLESDTLQSNLLELTHRLAGIDWLKQPLSRCRRCNTLLQHNVVPVPLHRVPGHIVARRAALRFCPVCDQFYWFGDHARRILEQLRTLNSKRLWNENV